MHSIIGLLCCLSLALQRIASSHLTTTYDGRYPPPVESMKSSYIELEANDELPYYKQPSYQNDNIDLKKYEQVDEPVPYLSTLYVWLRKAKLISSSATCSTLLAFMLHIRDICSDPRMGFHLFLMGLVMVLPFIFEISLTFVGFLDIANEQCSLVRGGGLNNTIRTLISMTAALLQITRIIAALIPEAPYETLADELCTWKGDTLFTSTQWTAFVFTPSVLLVAIPIIELVIGYLFPEYLSSHQRKNANNF